MISVYRTIRCWKCVIPSVFGITLFILWRQYMQTVLYKRNHGMKRITEGTVNTILRQGNVLTARGKSSEDEIAQDEDYETNDMYYNNPIGAFIIDINQDDVNKYPDASDYFHLQKEDDYGQGMHADKETESDDGNNETLKVSSLAKQLHDNANNLNEENAKTNETGNVVDEDKSIIYAEILETIDTELPHTILSNP